MGEGRCEKPYSASVLNISAMSFGALGMNAIRALNKGAQLGGFAHCTGEGGFSRYHKENGGDIIFQIGTGYFGCRNDDGTFNAEMFAEQAKDDQIKLIEIKHQAIEANIAKIDVGAQGTLVTFHQDDFPDPAGLLAYVDRLKGTAKLRPDMKLVINRAWGSPESRLNGLFQLTKGLSGVVRKSRKNAKVE